MGDIFLACKRGDLQRVKILVEEMLCDVNVTDKWNSTPLYYACLSGYDYIVYYLLQSGAQYDICNLSGERCMNCALTEETRHMLRNPPDPKQHSHNHFRDGMSFMMREAYQNYSDICLVIGPANHRLYAHKVILCSQSTYFAHSLVVGSNRGKYFVHFKHYKESSVAAWVEILRYIYTQTLEIVQHGTIFKDCLHLSRRLGLKELTSQLRDHLNVSSKVHKKGPDELVIESECCVYPDIADIAISDLKPEGRTERQHFADLCFIVENHRFYCHKGFVVGHSPYFEGLLDTDQFREVTTSTKGKLTFITLSNIVASTFALLLKFIYTGTTDINLETLQDLLFYSDHYMIHGLKEACGEVLATQLDLGDAVQTLSLARLLRMTRLQHAAVRFIAYNFENISEKMELAKLLVLDETTNRGDRLVRISECSVDSLDDVELEEDDLDYSEDAGVDILMDLRLYFHENTNKQGHSVEAQAREERCLKEVHRILCGEDTD